MHVDRRRAGHGNPAASSTSTPPSAAGMSPPIWTIFPSAIIRSAAKRAPAVTNLAALDH